MENEVKPALLTKTEAEWLNDTKQVSPSHARFMESTTNSKIKTFVGLELPLLISNGYLSNSAG